MTDEDKKFLQIIHNPAIRPALLARLRDLELLSAFQEIESGTKPKP